MGTRGFVWANYHSDDGNTYALQVDADYAAETGRGWTYPSSAGTPVYPRGWIPRHVIGVDSVGHERRAIIASPSAGLWSGSVLTFVVNGTDELPHTCAVTKRRMERIAARPR